jgi:hypothetical protein
MGDDDTADLARLGDDTDINTVEFYNVDIVAPTHGDTT